jgi:hypothetical protein
MKDDAMRDKINENQSLQTQGIIQITIMLEHGL